MMETRHIPVMVEEVLRHLGCRPGGIYFDGTLGGGGHAEAILESSAPDGIVIGADWDESAIRRASRRLEGFGRRVRFVHSSYSEIDAISAATGIQAFDGITLDLGVSSFHLDDGARGFRFDSPVLDMRMDVRRDVTARSLVNELSFQDLRRILRDYGQERYASRIARSIVAHRGRAQIVSAAELAAIVTKAIPSRARHQRIHPATRSFLALRIAVNEELAHLETFLEKVPARLKPGGMLCVITFQSLEERLVKEAFLREERGCRCPTDLPLCQCTARPRLRRVPRRAVVPTASEIEKNPRSRSAKLRIAERI